VRVAGAVGLAARPGGRGVRRADHRERRLSRADRISGHAARGRLGRRA
jgi:hypothetical protein